eukprot:3275595-Amphidinium_carterae.1
MTSTTPAASVGVRPMARRNTRTTTSRKLHRQEWLVVLNTSSRAQTPKGRLCDNADAASALALLTQSWTKLHFLAL